MPISEVYNQDCMIGMKNYPDKYFDLAIVDPPYGISKDGRNNHTRGNLAKAKDYSRNNKYDDFCPEVNYFFELIRISKNQIIWGANHFISKIPYDSSCWVIFDKNNGDNDFADCELAWTSFKTAVRKYKYTWNGMLQENMKHREERIHPNQKPINLYKWLLQTYAIYRDKILDTHMGSQSSRIAAYQMGFDYTGFEIDQTYFESGCKMFDLITSQQQLFI